MKNKTTTYQALPQYGCFVALSSDKKTIFSIPMNKDGTMDSSSEEIEVTSPDATFLNHVSKMFNTSFKLENFSGR